MTELPFGLDIGATTIKCVWLGKDKDQFSFLASSISPSPPRGLLSTSPLDEQEMVQAIKKAIIEANIKTKHVNVALAENQVYTKVLEMPALSDRELSSAIYWEAEQYIPIPLDKITLVWTVLDRPKKFRPNDKMQVLMVGAPTLLVEKYKKILTMAGLTINSMETEILATIRALTWGPAGSESFPASMIVNIGAVTTSLAIVSHGIIAFTYSTQIGGSAINRAIATDFGLSAAQAEEYKKVYGVSGKSLGGKIGMATQPILMSILSEVKKAIAFYSQKNSDQPIAQIILSGGTAKLPGIDLFFANNAGIETGIANPWKILAGRNLPPEVLTHASDYTIATDLSMKDYE